MAIFKSQKKVLAPTNYNRTCFIWRVNCFNARYCGGTFYIYNILVSKILGISAFYHDSAASIIINGKIIAAAQEERFSRIKHDSSYPFHAVEFVLNYAKIKLSDLS